ncbi:MAG: lysylphosphatidylglycerol synthase transmembrane domain-containing protein, partial [Acidimicrobiales bacterium]
RGAAPADPQAPAVSEARPAPAVPEAPPARDPWWRWDLRLHHRHRTLLKKSLRRGVAGFLVALVVEYLVLPQLAGAHKDLHLISSINLWYALLGVVLEAAALVAYAALTRAVLPRGSPSLPRLLRIDLSSLAVSHVLPGGTAGGTGVGYRLLTEAGVKGTDAGFGVATQGIGSAVVLNVILWLALIVSIPLQGFNPLYATAALVGVLLFAAFAALVLLLTRGEEHATRILRTLAARVPYVQEEAVTTVVRRLAARLRELGSDRRLLLRAVCWAAANWLLDAASLWVFLLAFHHATGPVALLVAYGLANVLAALPLTPGGLGIVEGVLIPILVAFGSTRGIVILGVISYRLVNFWLPIPVGALAYLSLRLEPGASRRRRAEELERLAEEAGRGRRRRAWAGPTDGRQPDDPALSR